MKDDVKRKYLPGGARIAGGGHTSTWNAQKESGRLGEKLTISSFTNGENDGAGDVCSEQQQCVSNVFPNAGYTGLCNLGNTCFMNCVIQALANITELRDYFLSKTFIDDINGKNPLGTQGRLANAFYTTLKHLWSGQEKPYAPLHLRNVVGSRDSQFLGIMQQDAQEFMAFFLDALHEDLNRIRVKPVFDIGKNENIPDDILAKKFWGFHKSRNDSFVVDKFHGMYKSRLTCPECEKESITFDPFLFLSVPLPKPMQLVSVVFLSVKYDYEILHVDVKVSKECGTMAELLNFISQKNAVEFDNLRVFEVESGRVVKEYYTNSLIPATKNSLIVYDIGVSKNSNETKSFFLLQTTEAPQDIDICAKCGKCPKDTGCKVRRCTRCKRVGYCNQECQKSDWPLHKTHCTPRPFISCPLLVNIPHLNCSHQYLSDILLKHAKITTSIYGNNHGVKDSRLSHLENFTKNKFDAQNLFNIILVHDEKMDNLTKVKEMDSEINLSDVTQIIIEWKHDVEAVGKSFKCGAGSKKHCDPMLLDCIHLFTQPEVLAAEDAWYCPNCKEHREATKELSLWHLPDILVIQLKRFSFRNRLWRDKIDKLVNFPVKGLDMSPFCIGDVADHPIYDLFAVVNHHGGLFGGHYTSYVKLTDESGTSNDLGWRLCDDSHVTSVRSEEDVVTSSAYVVFYQKRKPGLYDSNIENEIWHNARDDISTNMEKGDSGKPHFCDNTDDLAGATGIAQSHNLAQNNSSVNSTGFLDVSSPIKNNSSDKVTSGQNNSEINPVTIKSIERSICSDDKDILKNPSKEDLLYTDMDAMD